ncbi:chromatin associated protein KTI12 [Lipomyces arxii]|uniref:chromatin associated protein KTI12 n=1 Tax=Lipomyces arxii TaxID=56418 RepID=UPI0034CD9807
MPIILLTGYPCSGKSTRACEISAAFAASAKDRKVHVISDETHDIRSSVYRDAKQEKMARATIMSDIKRNLSRDTIVIVDGLNYIKGYRYQIFCEAKAEESTYAIVHVGTPVEVCREWNKKANAWEEDLFDQLVFRYEEPNGMNRWDSPLYTVSYSDPALNAENIIFKQLFNSIIFGKVKPPNFATILKPAVLTDYIYELDKQTQEVVKLIVERQADGGAQEIWLNDTSSVTLSVEPMHTAQLQRIRRNFVALNKVRQIDTLRIKGAFAEFLNRNFGTE